MILFALISAFIGLLFLFFIIFNKRNNWYLISYTIGKGFQAIGVFCFGMRFLLPDFISLHIGSIFLILGYALEIFNVVSYDNIFRRPVFNLILMPALFFVFLNLGFFNSPKYQLAILVAFMGAYYFAFGGIFLLKRKDKTKFVTSIAITYLLFSSIWLILSVKIIIDKENYQILYGEHIILIILYILATLNLIIGSVGYLMILKELDEKSIKGKNRIIESDNNKLKELNIKKDKFFSIIAHDLKSPIGALTQLGQLLLENHNEIPINRREKIITSIADSSKKTFNLLENLLQWSRSESGRLTTNPISLDIREIIDSTINLLQENISGKSISIKKEFPENIEAFGDYNMISTVIRNILSNAIKFVHENGNIIVSSEKNISDNKVKIYISDDGVGIKKRVMEKLFDIDSNYTSKGTNNESGTGLGLKLCKEFITKNNGEISVKSELNKGSTFCIILPVSK